MSQLDWNRYLDSWCVFTFASPSHLGMANPPCWQCSKCWTTSPDKEGLLRCECGHFSCPACFSDWILKSPNNHRRCESCEKPIELHGMFVQSLPDWIQSVLKQFKRAPKLLRNQVYPCPAWDCPLFILTLYPDGRCINPECQGRISWECQQNPHGWEGCHIGHWFMDWTAGEGLEAAVSPIDNDMAKCPECSEVYTRQVTHPHTM